MNYFLQNMYTPALIIIIILYIFLIFIPLVKCNYKSIESRDTYNNLDTYTNENNNRENKDNIATPKKIIIPNYIKENIALGTITLQPLIQTID